MTSDTNNTRHVCPVCHSPEHLSEAWCPREWTKEQSDEYAPVVRDPESWAAVAKAGR